ncbi:MAG: HAMP domain-containing histidine kinase, partial [Gammaproteobacteria bacterium]|nr:HAMP domain-containing histidine kinase [Gammaproteobacteria bacterium]NIR92697.1 HAMP domain-containing histidine kinase [Gammaproteobacteria bacterium]
RREEVVLEPMDFNGAVSEALKRLQWKVDSSKADIVLAGNNIPVMGYQPWIEEVVYNLISNAISHGGSNLTVTVSAEPADED